MAADGLCSGAPGNNQTSKIYNFFFDILQRFNTDELDAVSSGLTQAFYSL